MYIYIIIIYFYFIKEAENKDFRSVQEKENIAGLLIFCQSVLHAFFGGLSLALRSHDQFSDLSLPPPPTVGQF